MQLLPKWTMLRPMPVLYDTESATAIEMVGKVYGAMNELIKEYNSFADEVNTKLGSFTAEEQEKRKEFELAVTKTMREFQCSLEQYVGLNLTNTVKEFLNDALSAGTITITEQYDPETESLNLLAGGEV